MLNQIRADLYRQSRTVGFYLTLIVTCVYGAIVTYNESIGGITVNPSAGSTRLLARLDQKSWSVLDGLHSSMFSTSALLYVFIAFFVIVIGYEFSQKLYKNTLLTGISRLRFILAKYLMLLLDILFTMALFYATVVITGLVAGRSWGSSAQQFCRESLIIWLMAAFFISVVFSFAILLLLATNSQVISAVFIVIWPVAIALLHQFLSWSWLRYFDFFNTTIQIATKQLSTSMQFRYLGVSVLFLVLSIAGSTLLMRRKEL